MSSHDLYAYVEGTDLEGVVDVIEQALDEFIASREWRCGRAWVVDQRKCCPSGTRPGDRPLWDLGLNLELPDAGAEFPGWFSDVEAVVGICSRLSRETGRSFIVGLAGRGTSICDDMFQVDSSEPDLDAIATMMGVQAAR